MDQGEKLGGGADGRRVLYEGTEGADGCYWHGKVLHSTCISIEALTSIRLGHTSSDCKSFV